MSGCVHRRRAGQATSAATRVAQGEAGRDGEVTALNSSLRARGKCRQAGSGMSPVGGNRLSLERESRKHWAEEPGKPRIPPRASGRSSAHPPASGRVRPEVLTQRDRAVRHQNLHQWAADLSGVRSLGKQLEVGAGSRQTDRQQCEPRRTEETGREDWSRDRNWREPGQSGHLETVRV